MRLLVQCSDCQRQYDATGWDIGSAFHCSCGAIVRVVQPQGHDASVVRCSSCGAPRTGGEEVCNFCQSEFTLHEMDMHTVCPGCLARISEKSKYCHHCSMAIIPESTAGEVSELKCPSCEDQPHLHSRRIASEQATVLECHKCAGLWLGHDAFNVLSKRADQEFQHRGAEIDWSSFPQGEQESDWRYRMCPKCAYPMVRRVFGKRSGVMIDLCREHGVWFDANELKSILAWIRSGGLAIAGKAAADTARRRAKERALEDSFLEEMRGELYRRWL
jgi:Zn-finger nucleic acid-binding protein